MPVLGRLGHALNVRAVLTVNDEGRISLVGPARGRRGAIKRLVQDAVAAAPVQYIAVGHTRRPEEAEEMADELARQLGLPRAQIPALEIGSVLIAHAGEGTMGVVAVSQQPTIESAGAQRL